MRFNRHRFTVARRAAPDILERITAFAALDQGVPDSVAKDEGHDLSSHSKSRICQPLLLLKRFSTTALLPVV